MKRPSKPETGLILLLLGSAAGVTGCSAPEPAPEPLRAVRTVEVVPGGGSRTRVLSGVAVPGRESRLSFRVGGAIERLPVRVGDRVGKGQLLATLDPTDFRLQVQQAEAALAHAQAAAEGAALRFDMVRDLYENSNASKSDYDQARAQDLSARAEVDAARAQLDLARQQLDYTRLVSPVAGAVAAVGMEENENAGPGQTVVVLTSGDRPEVEVAMPEVLISQIEPGDEVEVAFAVLEGRWFGGQVTEVGVATTRSAPTYPVRVRLATDAGGQIRPGMAAEVAFSFDDESDERRVFLPSVAVGEDRQGRYVLILEDQGDGTGVVRRRSVEVGELTSSGLEIRAGLDRGERVVVAGVRRLQDGGRVRVLEQEGSS